MLAPRGIGIEDSVVIYIPFTKSLVNFKGRGNAGPGGGEKTPKPITRGGSNSYLGFLMEVFRDLENPILQGEGVRKVISILVDRVPLRVHVADAIVHRVVLSFIL